MSSQQFDDNQCSIPRPAEGAEVRVPFAPAATQATTDESVALDVRMADAGGVERVYYALIKRKEGNLLFALYPTAESRPQAIDEANAQVFAPLP